MLDLTHKYSYVLDKKLESRKGKVEKEKQTGSSAGVLRYTVDR